jgi:hypothetical protein
MFLLLACIDNGFQEKDEVVEPLDTSTLEDSPVDTGELPSCEDHPAPQGYTAEVDGSCIEELPPGTFNPSVEWHWESSTEVPSDTQVVMSPVVIDLDQDGVPEVLAITYGAGYRGQASTLRALRGTDGEELWALKATLGSINGTSGVGAADVDGDGTVEIFVCTVEKQLLAIDHQGNELWATPNICTSGEDAPSLHDLDGDGQVEVVVGRTWLDGDGNILAQGSAGRGAAGSYGAMSFGADVNGDGVQEVIAGNTVYNLDGSILWTSNLSDGQPAIADVESDGVPDLFTTGAQGLVRYEADTGGVVWGPLAHAGGGYGGPPTLADFDGDGALEIGVAGRTQYIVYEGDGSTLWSMPIDEGSVAITGSAVFDFEGDGAAEVIQADQSTLWVFDGATGAVELEWTEHGSGTVSEFPVVADVDGDQHAEIILGHNKLVGGPRVGITVIGDADDSWVDAGQVWNQHAFHISHIEDDGSVPAYVDPWTDHNSFRAGRFEGLPTYGLPDLVVTEVEWCEDTCPQDLATAWVAIENQGQADVTAALVSINGHPSQAVSLAAGEATWLGPYEVAEGLVIVVDLDDEHAECNETNNAKTFPWPC